MVYSAYENARHTYTEGSEDVFKVTPAHPSSSAMIIWIGLIIILGYLLAPRRKRTGLPLPPGPPGLPLIGNVLDFPTSDFARKFHELGIRYGGPIFLCGSLEVG